MRLPRGRGLVRLGAGAAVLAVACLAGLSGGPAFAADSLGSQADLAVHVPGPQVALGAGEKDIRIDVTNHGPGNVLHGKLTIGTDNLADGVSVDLPTGSGCETQGTKVVCDLDALPAGGHDSTVSVFLAHDPKVAKVGPVGSLSVSVSSELADPDMTNNSETVQLELVNPGIDLFVQGFDVQLSPGQSATLPFTVLNQGTVATVTSDVAVRLPEFVTFVADPACDLSEHESAAVCHFGALAPG